MNDEVNMLGGKLTIEKESGRRQACGTRASIQREC